MSIENTTPPKAPTIPLSLYIHFPWCLSKCPYCDFNSYAMSDKSLIATYVNKLLIDLERTVPFYKNKELISIYFGGGTPSLLPPHAVATIIQYAKKYFYCAKDTEITIEANPGTIDLSLCQELKHAGINRLSLGIQSFNDEKLKNIKRVHNAQEALVAVDIVREAGFTNFNLDLMYGLPGQTTKDALADLKTALSFEPPHLSWYQLTLDELKSPLKLTAAKLPYGEKLWQMQKAGQECLAEYGLQQYEVSAYCRSPNDRCNHNVNYWLYGDYIGIGAGAHGKVTLDNYAIKRYAKIASPAKYLESENLIESEEVVAKEKLPLEFMLNALRLYQPVSYDLLQNRTGLTIDTIKKQLQSAENLGLIELREEEGVIVTTEHGKNFLNDLLEIFL